MPEVPPVRLGVGVARGVATWRRTVPDGMGGMRPQETVLGPGAAAAIPRILSGLRPRSMLVVHGRRSFEASGAADLLSAGVPASEVVSFDAFGSNPRVDDVQRGVEAARRIRPDVVLGVGGGSAMDVAKCVAVLASQTAPVRRCLDQPGAIDLPRSARLLLVPTVTGSGSEVTGFATVFVDGRKRSLDHPGMHADMAVVDPGLTLSAPAGARVSASLDALCHSVESMWSIRGTDASRAVARLALRLVCRGLGLADGDRAPLETRRILGEIRVSATGALGLSTVDPPTAMSAAATLAGLAIDLTRTTAAHAFAYPLTARFGVPHGAACALNLQWLLGYNAEVDEASCRHPLGASFVRGVVGEAAGPMGGTVDAVAILRDVLSRGGFEWWLGAYGVRRADVPRLVDEAIASDRAATNPRAVGPGVARAALAGLLEPDGGPAR